jgi:hypothetical protein
MIEAFPGYDGQDRCTPDPKPGVAAFRSEVMSEYPWTGDFGISRACHIGGQSEHKEGRAWDWAANAASERDSEAVSDLLAWLFAEDRYGNKHARARRVGVMYLIWNRRIWFPGSGWRTYCVQRKRGCVSPSDGGIRHPHTDHVHFSFTWAGARKTTTFHHSKRSRVSTAATGGSGYVLAGGNGGVRSYGMGWHGDLSGDWLREPIVASAARPLGDGYWLVGRSGRVYAFGAAAKRRGAGAAEASVVDIAATPTGGGYWIVSRSGEVFARGDAVNFGSPQGRARIVAIAPTSTGAGYWLATRNGRVLPFGDAPALGDVRDEAEVVDLAPAPLEPGYWLLSPAGEVFAFGAAVEFGERSFSSQDAVALLPTASGSGYRIVTSMGRVVVFGDATSYRSALTLDAPTYDETFTPSPEEIPHDY